LWLWSEAADGPSATGVEFVEEAIVQAAKAALPEFNSLRLQAITTPMLRAIDVSVAIQTL
jgi:hypothetical protein